MLSGCASPGEQAPPPSEQVSVEEVKTEVTRAFTEAEDFWNAQGVSIVPAPSLMMPEDETVVCGTETVDPAKGTEVIAAACHVTNTLLIWPEPFAAQIDKAIEKGAVLRTVVALVVKHDYGHFVQRKMGIGQGASRLIIEPQADCLAGAAMQASIRMPRNRSRYYGGIEEHLGRPDTRHGNAEQRLASFTLGYTLRSGDDRSCDDVVPLGR